MISFDGFGTFDKLSAGRLTTGAAQDPSALLRIKSSIS
jgi:hypothetical protein